MIVGERRGVLAAPEVVARERQSHVLHGDARSERHRRLHRGREAEEVVPGPGRTGQTYHVGLRLVREVRILLHGPTIELSRLVDAAHLCVGMRHTSQRRSVVGAPSHGEPVLR